MALDDIKHVQAVAIIKRLLKDPLDPEGRAAGEVFLGENRPEPDAYMKALRAATADPWPHDDDPPDPL